MPFGTEILRDGSVRFRLWAPAARAVALDLDGPPKPIPLAPKSGGWFEIATDKARAGSRYRFVIDGEGRFPDPASRFQPDDVDGASEVVDPAAFEWNDGGWRCRPWAEAVVYELHLGAFTREGTFDGAIAALDHLAELGVTAVELMPVADFAGRRNWGYDGVYPFAPDGSYGRPEDLKRLVEAAHQRGLMVFLDVVYNHFGPEGNHLHRYAPAFFSERYSTPWGMAIDFESAESRPVREFFIHNALYWLTEYHMDGLRLDAVHAVFDRSRPDFLSELAEAVHRRFAGKRNVHLVLENDNNAARYLARDDAGRPARYVAQWNDDWHHAAHVLLTGEREGYYQDYLDAPARHFGRALAEGFAYQGESSRYRGNRPRGEKSGHLPATAFVAFLQNHDQVGNRAHGERITGLAEAEAIRAALGILLLAPSPPLLFMGEEWAARQPFPFFCDFEPDLAARVREGRREGFARFSKFRDPTAREGIPDPNAPATFASAVLNWADAGAAPHREWLGFYRRLLSLRHAEIVPRLGNLDPGAAGYRVVGRTGLEVDWPLRPGGFLSLVANLGGEAVRLSEKPPSGRVLYASDEGIPERISEGLLPPWSVMWSLVPGSPARAG